MHVQESLFNLLPPPLYSVDNICYFLLYTAAEYRYTFLWSCFIRMLHTSVDNDIELLWEKRNRQGLFGPTGKAILLVHSIIE